MFKFTRLIICSLALLLTASRFPPGSNVVDPLNYGAVPNDGISDVVSFQNAVYDAASVGHIYEITGNPGDVYDIDIPIKSQILHGNPPTLKWVNNWIVMCDPGVIIQIPDNSPAFANPAAPQALFQYGSTTLSSPTAPPASGGGNEGYRNTFDGHCIIDLGRGNPGARGLDLVVNNRGVIRDVTIRSGDGICDAGIWAGRPWPGPALIEGVEIDGCKNGIWDGFTQYGLVIRNSFFHNQTLYAINTTADATTIENVHSVNSVPALRVESPAGFATVINSKFEGGVSTKGAIQLGTQSKLYLRDTAATGYGALIRHGTVLRGDVGMSVSEWTSHPGFTPDGSTPKSLRLPPHEPPHPYDSRNWDDWANVKAYGGNPRDALDDRADIMETIASGKPILQLDQDLSGLSTYYVSDTIDIPCSVRRIEGMESRLITTASFPNGHDLFRFASDCDWSDVTTIEHVWLGGRFGPMINHSDARTLYLKDGYFAASSTGIWANAGSGWLFLTNVVTKHLQIEGPHSVWAWQLNPEGFAGTGVPVIPNHGIVNNGGDVRLVGVKTEGKPSFTLNSGRTELLGSMLMPCVGEGSNDVVGPGFKVVPGAQFSGNWINWCGKSFDLATWDIQVQEMLNNITYEVWADQLPSYTVEGGWRVFMPLYRSAQSNTCEGN